MKDYRVRMTVTFDLDLAARDYLDAEQAACVIVREVFADSFSRAECLKMRPSEAIVINRGKDA